MEYKSNAQKVVNGAIDKLKNIAHNKEVAKQIKLIKCEKHNKSIPFQIDKNILTLGKPCCKALLEKVQKLIGKQ